MVMAVDMLVTDPETAVELLHISTTANMQPWLIRRINSSIITCLKQATNITT